MKKYYITSKNGLTGITGRYETREAAQHVIDLYKGHPFHADFIIRRHK